MRILFMGTPDFSLRFLEKIMESDEVIGVVTVGSRPTRRGHQLEFSAIKKFALKQGLRLFESCEVSQDSFLESIRELGLDLIVVVSFGKILSKEILRVPRKGAINVHFSLLPKYRGPAPIQWALLNGDKYTGVSVIYMEEEVDAGDIIVQKEIAVEPEDNYSTLLEKLCSVGVGLLGEALFLIKEGKVSRTPQDTSKATYAPLLKKSDGKIGWREPAFKIYNRIRALNPWPGTYIILSGGRRINIVEATVTEFQERERARRAGEIAEIRKGKGFVVTCGEGGILITRVKPEGKPVQNAFAYAQGARLKIGDVWGEDETVSKKDCSGSAS